jgi:HTH-type transcriptional regulator / antitoxin HigA
MDDYGQQRHPIAQHRHTPLQILRFLMEQHEMNVTALGTVLGNKTAASLVLAGRRELSKSHIRLLADYFRVDPGLFFE